MTRVALSRNGTRQPHEENCSSVISWVQSRKTTLASTTPAGTPIWGAAP
jgi:hypothetical protein